MQNAKSKFVTAICSLAMALTTSCLEDSGNNNANSAVQKYLYCAYPGIEMCMLGPFAETDCAAGGMPINECPQGYSLYGATVSSSSSIQVPSSSADAIQVPSSSSSAVAIQVPSSSSSVYAAAVPAANFTFDKIKYWVGEGSNRAMLIVQWNDGKAPAALAWGYRWNGQKYGIDMIMDILKADGRLFALLFYSGPTLGYAIAGVGYDISGNNFFQLRNGSEAPQPLVNGIVEASRYDFDDWTCTDNSAHWKAGWYVGYWSYWVADNINSQWEYSGLGASSRELTNNSVDAWYFDNDMSSYYSCMENGEDCSGKTFFGNITPR